MKIIRYLDSHGQAGFAANNRKISGDIFGAFSITDELADVRKVLAPVTPAALLLMVLPKRVIDPVRLAFVPIEPSVVMAAIQACGSI